MDSKVILNAAKFVKKNYRNTLERLSDSMADAEPLTVEDLNLLHDETICEFGGTPEIRDASLLESIAVSPSQSVFGQDLYPTLLDKAAKYILDFARYQVYVDGNKRMGLAAATLLLAQNGIKLTLDENEAYNIVMDIATGKLDDIEVVADALKANYEFLPESVEEMEEIEDDFQ